ncbi:MAG: pentapeptide repeat-containing protein [Cyanobacteriota bacterium]|nr:pentapeptide repeat-containing protein [Cyanobacteriota bacterium]
MKSAELLKRYQQGERNFSKFNLSRFMFYEVDLKEVNFSGANLSYANLSGSDLSDADLSGANLSEADLCGTNLENANCQGADFRNAELIGDCHGINTNYSYADFRGDALDQGIIEKSNFTGANFTGSFISQYSFIDCDFTAANFSYSRLSEVSFDNCNLTNVDFSGASLGFGFRSSTLNNVSFQKATFDISNPRYYDEIEKWSNVDFTRTVFYFGRYSQLTIPKSVNASQVIVIREGSDLSGLDLSECNLENLDLSEVNLTNTNLTRAKLPEDSLESMSVICCNTILPDGSIYSNVDE